MKLGIDNFIERIKSHYDKVIAITTVAGLVISVLLVVLQLGLIRQRQASFRGWLQGLRPLNEEVRVVDPEGYDAARAMLANPAQLADDSSFFVPEARFSCSECRHPVPLDAEACPFCGALVTPPEPETVDHDGDGIPTKWESRYGLRTDDPTDAAMDADGDGFTNLEEFDFGTDPTDPISYPPLLKWLMVEDVEGRRFGLQFKSRIRTQTGYKFGVNYRLPNGQIKTDFVELGENVGGFELESYEEKVVKAEPPRPGMVDRSELTIITPRGDQIILVKDQPVMHVELTAHLELDRATPEFEASVRQREQFDLDGATYKVIAIDAKTKRVIIQNISNRQKIMVTQIPKATMEQSERESEEEASDPEQDTRGQPVGSTGLF